MDKMKVIEHVNKPTDWVSNILAVEKHNKRHDLWICLDQKHLNKAIKISNYNIPKPDELISQLTGKTLFTVSRHVEWVLADGIW